MIYPPTASKKCQTQDLTFVAVIPINSNKVTSGKLVNKPQSVPCILLLETAEIPWIVIRLKIIAVQEREFNETGFGNIAWPLVYHYCRQCVTRSLFEATKANYGRKEHKY